MWEKSSDDLNQELMAQPNLDQYLTENEGYWRHADISVFLTRLQEGIRPVQSGAGPAGVDKRGLSPPVFFRAAQALPGPVAVPVHQHGDQSGGNAAAAQAGGVFPTLYPKLKRDAIIVRGILHRTSLAQINDKLFSENEKTLF